tara:strand:+ start:2429 stop:2737 length:309 start_codon:yes stop_codon:yes gene_type:complete
MSITKAAAEFGEAVGAESLLVSSSAVALTKVGRPASAMVTNGAEPIRVAYSAVSGIADPTSSVGHYLNPYTVLELFGTDIDNVKFIRVSSNSTIYVTYFGGA